MNDVPDSGLSTGEAARRIGVAVTTVRTWDRRYGLGPSVREPGRHRRYNSGDVARLALMRRLTADGVAPAEAARIARDQQSPHDPGQPEEAVAPPRERGEGKPGTAKGLRRAAMALDPADVGRILALALTEGAVPAWTAK